MENCVPDFNPSWHGHADAMEYVHKREKCESFVPYVFPLLHKQRLPIVSNFKFFQKEIVFYWREELKSFSKYWKTPLQSLMKKFPPNESKAKFATEKSNPSFVVKCCSILLTTSFLQTTRDLKRRRIGTQKISSRIWELQLKALTCYSIGPTFLSRSGMYHSLCTIVECRARYPTNR